MHLRSLQRSIYAIGFGAVSIVMADFGLVTFTEWRLANSIRPVGLHGPGLLAAVAGPLLFAALDLLMGALMILYVGRLVGGPIDQLTRTAVQIAKGGRPRVPFADRTDEVGQLARALEGWRDASETRETLLTSAPVVICQADQAGLLLDVNRAAMAMLGYPREALLGRGLLTLIHPDDVAAARARVEAVLEGRLDRTDFETRVLRADGSPLWCSVAVAPVGGEHRPESSIVILDDISSRHVQSETAASVQRELVPHDAPSLRDYELAGTCLPAADMAGDLYDWTLTDDGHLDLTVADVMGKGMRAALVMARLQTALTAAPSSMGPAARVAAADRWVTFNMDGAEPFVTLFHARLELETGVLRYVDAGHGHCLIVRDGGEVVRLAGASLPLGLGLGGVFREDTARLQPGDVLAVHSDGLLDVGDRPLRQWDLGTELRRGEDAEAIVHRLADRVPARPPDDATLVVLRRLAGRALAPPDGACQVTIGYEAEGRNLDLVHETLARFWRRLPALPDERWRMLFELAVLEVEANIVEHARPTSLRLQLSVADGRVVAEFYDGGEEWNGLAQPPPPVEELKERGRGLAIARAAVDEVCYERSGTANRWRLVKSLPSRGR